MAEIIRPAHMEYASEQRLEYRYRIDPKVEANYRWCGEHPEEVECLGVTTHRWSFKESALARCECGKEIFLLDDYYGCSQCSRCGRWHAMSGREVIRHEVLYSDTRNFKKDRGSQGG